MKIMATSQEIAYKLAIETLISTYSTQTTFDTPREYFDLIEIMAKNLGVSKVVWGDNKPDKFYYGEKVAMKDIENFLSYKSKMMKERKIC